MSFSSQQPGRSQPRGSQSRRTVRLGDLAMQERDTVFYAPRGADWLWLGIFAAVMLGSGFYLWQELGFDSVLGRAAFFAAVLLSILWAALIYTFKLSASVTVGRRGIGLALGPWRSELIWPEVAHVEEHRHAADEHRLRWLVVGAYDGRELRVREDMVADFTRLRAEVFERRRLWEEHGGTWGASGGGPFSAEEQVASLMTWWLVVAGALLLPGLYFALLLSDTFLLGVALVALAALATLQALRIALGRTTYIVDQRTVVASRQLRRTTLRWNEITKVERVRSRVRLLARLGILAARVLLAVVGRADNRIASFPWSPRVPEYLVLRAEGGRRIRVRLHRLASPDELLAWIEFYERVARHHVEPATPSLAGRSSDGGAPVAAGPPVALIPPASDEAGKGAANPATAISGAKVTKPVLGSSGVHGSEIDPRILAVMRDVGDVGDVPKGAPGNESGNVSGNESGNGSGNVPEIPQGNGLRVTQGTAPGDALSGTKGGAAGRAPASDWLNESADESILPFNRAPGGVARSPREGHAARRPVDETGSSSSFPQSSASGQDDGRRGGKADRE